MKAIVRSLFSGRERAARIAALRFDPYRDLPHARLDSCDLCQTGVFRTIARRDRYGFEAAYHLCECCGLVFQNPRPTAEGYGKFYESVYRPLLAAFKGKHVDPAAAQAADHSYRKRLVDILKPFVGRIDQAIDLGGSTGAIARTVQDAFGGRCAVVDPAPDEVAAARRLGLEAEVGVAETWDPGDRRYDLILICRSIDHCLSIGGTLRNVRRAMAPGGRLFIDAVDFGTLAVVRPDFRKYLKIDHPFYLSDETMRAYLAATGFRVLATDASGSHLAYVAEPAEPLPVSETRSYARPFGTTLRERVVAQASTARAAGPLASIGRRIKRVIGQ